MGKSDRGLFNWRSVTFFDVIRILTITMCGFLALISALGLWDLYVVSDRGIPRIGIINRIYLTDACTLGVAIIGAYAAYSKNSMCLWVFAIIITIHSIAYLWVAYLIGNYEGNRLDKKSVNWLMTDYAKSYQWDLAIGAAPNDATRIWDTVQSLAECCGLQEPSDWTVGPLATKGNVENFPRSCCANYSHSTHNSSTKCTSMSNDLFSIGCLDEIFANQNIGPLRSILIGLMSALLAIFAFPLARISSRIPASVGYILPVVGLTDVQKIPSTARFTLAPEQKPSLVVSRKLETTTH